MDTIQLFRLLENIPVKGEVCAKDLLPQKKPVDMKAYIVNTDISTDPGEHWVAIYFRGNQAIYFDSYGMSPEKEYTLPFIERNSSHWIQNTEMLQSPWSRTCGVWCIYIIQQLNKGLDLKTAIHEHLYGTGEDVYQNDRDIDMWFWLTYGGHFDSHHSPVQLRRVHFKHRVQICKCLRYTDYLSKKYPMYLYM